ncbi:hypothetical protein Tco_0951066, partial [Tanacetum coccineum]
YVVVGNGKFLVLLSSMFWGCIHDTTDNGMDVGLPEDWVHQSYTLQTWRDVYSFKVNPVNGRPKKRKKSVREIDMVNDGKLTNTRVFYRLLPLNEAFVPQGLDAALDVGAVLAEKVWVFF